MLAQDRLQHAQISLFQERFPQVTNCPAPKSVRQCWGLKHPFICLRVRVQMCTYVMLIWTRTFRKCMCCVFTSSVCSQISVWRLQTGIAASSLWNPCFLFKKTTDIWTPWASDYPLWSQSKSAGEEVSHPNFEIIEDVYKPLSIRINSHTCISRNSVWITNVADNGLMHSYWSWT